MQDDASSFENVIAYKLLNWLLPQLCELWKWNSNIVNVWETTILWLTFKIRQNWNLTCFETGMCQKKPLSNTKTK